MGSGTTLSKVQVTRLYRRLAPRYDLWARLTETKARQRCLRWAGIRDGESVLEVAVGTGLTFAEILARNPTGRNEGIDLTEAMLERAREKAARLGVEDYRLALGDAYALEFPDDSFDVLVNNYMFDLLPEADFPAVLDEFRRVLRPGGRLSMVNMTRPERWYEGLWNRLYRLSPSLVGGCRGVSLTPHLASAGFSDIRREFVSQMSFPSEVVHAIKPPA